jgi:hypothetical protein
MDSAWFTGKRLEKEEEIYTGMERALMHVFWYDIKPRLYQLGRIENQINLVHLLHVVDQMIQTTPFHFSDRF